MSQPFLTFYTPTYQRPKQLAACLASVATQTAVAAVEQIVTVDHLGIGIGGMYAKVPDYVGAVHGEYVHILADDDVLASPDVVEQVRRFARQHDNPPVILVSVDKAGSRWPSGPPWPPQMGSIDLGCVITRADVWKQHAKDYGQRYEGDYDFMAALHAAGHEALFLSILFLRGAVSRGQAEAAA